MVCGQLATVGERWLFGMLISVVLALSACSNQQNVEPTQPTGSRVAVPPNTTTAAGFDAVAVQLGFRLPAVDRGVIVEHQLIGTSRDVFLEIPLSPIDENGIKVSAVECEQVAPGFWVWSGEFDVPEDIGSFRAVVSTGWTRGDKGYGVLHDVTIAGSGPFALIVDRRQAEEPDEIRASVAVTDDAMGECEFLVLLSEVPHAGFPRGPAELAPEPLMYDAPSGSVAALGVGAMLADESDWRRIYAYLTWYQLSMPFEELWLPDLDNIAFTHARVVAPPDRPCRALELEASRPGAREVSLVQHRDCPSMEPSYNDAVRTEPPVVLDGWEWFATQLTTETGSIEQLWVRTDLADRVVVIGGPDANEIAQIADSLISIAAGPSVDAPAGPGLGETLDEAIATRLAEIEATELARFEYRDG